MFMNEKLENIILSYVTMAIGDTYVIESHDFYDNPIFEWIGKNNGVAWFNVKLIDRSMLYVNIDIHDTISTMFGITERATDKVLIKWFNNHQSVVKVHGNAKVLFILGRG